MAQTKPEPSKNKKRKPLNPKGEDAFSSRAVRSFMSKIGSGLLSAAGYEVVEYDDEAEPPIPVDPAEEAAEEARLHREEQLAVWRAEFQQIILVRKERQDAFSVAKATACERMNASGHTVRQQLNEANNEPIPEQTVIEPEQIKLAEPVVHEVHEQVPASDADAYNLPSADLFDKPETTELIFIDPEELEQQKQAVQDTLAAV